MKTLILLMMLTTLLGSCRNRYGIERPELDIQTQKSPFFVTIEVDGKTYIDINESYCFSRLYDISRDRVGPVDEPIKLDILECNKIVGRSPDDYGVFATWVEDMRHWLLGFKRKKRKE